MGNVSHIRQGNAIAGSGGFFVERVVLIEDFVYTVSEKTIEVDAIYNGECCRGDCREIDATTFQS